MQDSSNFNASLPPEFDQLCDLMQKSEQSPFAIIGISIAAGKVPTEYYNTVQENPSKQASKDMYSRFTVKKKKRRHCKMS